MNYALRLIVILLAGMAVASPQSLWADELDFTVQECQTTGEEAEGRQPSSNTTYATNKKWNEKKWENRKRAWRKDKPMLSENCRC